jgi:hypothetical protein
MTSGRRARDATRVLATPGLSAASDTVPAGVRFCFTVRAIGSPAPTITKAGRLPRRIKFTPGRRGTARISGIPPRGTAGVHRLILTARNPSGTATQIFTLTVTGPHR